MKAFQRIGQNVDVWPLMHALQRNPDLWNADRLRTTFTGSPHAEAEDILLRFEDVRLASDDPGFTAHIESAERVWKPAWYRLAEARAIVQPLMLRTGAYELARLIVTRLKPGGRILPHADTQGAYAQLPDIARYHVVLQGLPGSMFMCGDETVCMETGEVWWFDARQVHEVVNGSADDRIHLLVDLRLM